MGRHREWRKMAKKERRRKIRTNLAKKRDSYTFYNESEHDQWRQQQEMQEKYEMEQIYEANKAENKKWVEAELISVKKWISLQQHKEKLRQQQLKEDAKLKLERELEKQKKEKELERLKEIEKDNKEKHDKFIMALETFLKGYSKEPPSELLISNETKPDRPPCPFFYKTACCRFGDFCSRNHEHPGVSRVLLATNFYIHFGLENTDPNEYDTDVMLEYEDSDTYRAFKDFFYDVLPEFEKFGKVVEFKASKVINAVLCLQLVNRCPKGRACNFLHIYKNPDDLFNNELVRKPATETPRRNWRWSESPELELTMERRQRSKTKNYVDRDDRKRSRHHRRRSRSSDKNR